MEVVKPVLLVVVGGEIVAFNVESAAFVKVVGELVGVRGVNLTRWCSAASTRAVEREAGHYDVVAAQVVWQGSVQVVCQVQGIQRLSERLGCGEAGSENRIIDQKTVVMLPDEDLKRLRSTCKQQGDQESDTDK